MSYNKAWAEKRRARLRKAGLCVVCAKGKIASGKASCRKCLDRARAYWRKRAHGEQVTPAATSIGLRRDLERQRTDAQAAIKRVELALAGLDAVERLARGGTFLPTAEKTEPKRRRGKRGWHLRRRYARVCEWCSQPFKGKRKTTMFCSKAHNDLYLRREKERKAEEKAKLATKGAVLVQGDPLKAGTLGH